MRNLSKLELRKFKVKTENLKQLKHNEICKLTIYSFKALYFEQSRITH